MAKRSTGVGKMKKTSSKKTAKRLSIKRALIKTLQGRRGATKNYR